MEISDELQLIINKSYLLAKKNQEMYVTVEHFFLSSLEYPSAIALLKSAKISIKEFRVALLQMIKENSVKTDDIEKIPLQNGALVKLLEAATDICVKDGEIYLDILDIYYAIFDLKNSSIYKFFKEKKFTKADCSKFIYRNEIEISNVGIEDLFEQYENEDEDADELIKKDDKEFILSLTEDLTEKAKKSLLNTFVGREDLLDEIILVLSRKIKNNPMLIGEEGVGKTALIEGIAKLIVKDKVPRFLKNKKILSLQINSLIAGTRYRGDFENRIKKLFSIIEKDKNTILFIDEIHSIVTTGSSDASNIFKPYLSSGKISCIGATTRDEYKKILEKEKAFSRRFQTIIVPEPTKNETKKILLKLRAEFEDFHLIKIPKELIDDVVELSSKFLREKNQPDKSIDLIDQTSTLLKFKSLKSGNLLTPVMQLSDLHKMIAKMANISEKIISTSETEKLLSLKDNLKKYIFGQDQAIDSIVNAIKREKVGFREDNRPIASFLFVGPTGVGKTELSKKLADQLGVGFIRFDMSEYQEKFDLTKLIGSPPGYVGYQEGGLLIDSIRKTPQSVLLFDEIEKAHSDIFNILLQAMDYATITDSNGRKADLRNIIIIMTSNVGATKLEKGDIGFSNGEEHQENSAKLKSSVNNFFTPEFRNRLDEIIVFKNLPKKVIINIVKKEVQQFLNLLKTKNITATVDSQLYNFLAKKGYSYTLGARNISRVVDYELKTLFVDEILFGNLKNGGKVLIYIEDEKIKLKFSNNISNQTILKKKKLSTEDFS